MTEAAVTGLEEQRVRGLLAAAGMPASEAEVAACVASVPVVRGMAALLHAAEGLRYLDPALRFRAEPGGR
ncbi:hypothetical protein VSH64_45280 [Amycolatopsis rhabdoformis]|uniref:Uncharacterized protein n=1 Tax=Amycolatopsis rhabdoformis TaxID=1448059 RepID=A0ABZ1I6I4_9PSEU|nr:hypothetical protein [Amycolatopsis rhabdoformis]WSE29930.1 hypothetical protein VSH64_45280 [Amycolatopsis rhabdoformis]